MKSLCLCGMALRLKRIGQTHYISKAEPPTMQLSEAIRILRDHEADLKKMGVRKLYVFGSTVRGDQRADSDVDLFFDDDGTLNLFDIMDIKEATAGYLGCEVDIMTRDSINRFIMPYAEAEAVSIF